MYSSFQNYRVHLKNQEVDLLQFFSTCKNAFLKFERHIFLYRLDKFDNLKRR
jgi:hypothetical protein